MVESLLFIWGFLTDIMTKNFYEATNFELLVLFLGSAVTIELLYLCLCFFINNKDKAAIVLFFMVFPFGLFNLFLNYHGFLFKFLHTYGGFLGRYRIIVPVWFIMFYMLSFYINRYLDIKKARSVLLIFSGMFFLNNVFFLMVRFYKNYHLTTSQSYKILQGSKEFKTPNIYYIILDAYARADVLKERFGYDNSEFINFLQSKGFFVLSQSCSNYHHTLPSLSSTLIMDYLDHGALRYGYPLQSYNFFQHSPVMTFLRQHEYTTININSIWSITSNNRDFTYKENILRVGSFTVDVIRSTPLSPFLEYFSWFSKGDRIKGQLDTLKTIAQKYKSKKPFFVFCHIECPHLPVAFDQYGNVINNSHNGLMIDNQRKPYVQQVIALNSYIKEAVTAILEDSESSNVIILQSDHGDFSERAIVDDALQEDHNVLLSIKDRMSNLSALYVPEIDKEHISESMTNVNVFRTIFKHCFNANINLLPDKCFWMDGTEYTVDDINAIAFDNTTNKEKL